MKFVEPKTHLVGYTTLDWEGIRTYLRETDQMEFYDELLGRNEETGTQVSEGEALCSFYAKLCYSSLTTKKNKNISKVRGIAANIKGTFDQGHGSVFEHCWLNFVTTSCSRVFTHELVRHRVGTAHSQTSGRYVRGNEIDFVFDPILEPVNHVIESTLGEIEEGYYKAESLMGLNGREALKHYGIFDPDRYAKEQLGIDDLDNIPMDRKKKITSALRRILPNGQSNEIGWSVNVRSLRHFLMVRSNRHAEWEIRKVADQVYRIVEEKFPLMLYGAKTEMVEGALEITGMKLQPY